MKTIAKFVVQPGQQQMMIPSESVLSAGSVNAEIFLYALTDMEDIYERPYEVRVYETNQEIDAELEGFHFLGTVKTANGKIFHVFYKGISSMDF